MAREFDDINIEKMTGIFGGDSGLDPDVLTNMNKVVSRVEPEGLSITFSCPKCRMQKQIVVEYHELAAIAAGLAPQFAFGGIPWMYDSTQGALYPQAQCSTCSSELPIMLSPKEAGTHLSNALQAGFLKQNDLQQYTARVQAVKRQYGQ